MHSWVMNVQHIYTNIYIPHMGMHGKRFPSTSPLRVHFTLQLLYSYKGYASTYTITGYRHSPCASSITAEAMHLTHTITGYMAFTLYKYYYSITAGAMHLTHHYWVYGIHPVQVLLLYNCRGYASTHTITGYRAFTLYKYYYSITAGAMQLLTPLLDSGHSPCTSIG